MRAIYELVSRCGPLNQFITVPSLFVGLYIDALEKPLRWAAVRRFVVDAQSGSDWSNLGQNLRVN